MGGITRAQIRQDFAAEKSKLYAMARLKPHQNLTMFLDGAGGSGKSRVVGELLKYAEDYTSRLQLTFNMRTIVVTAMSGVAATCIGGETLHSAACFNRKIPDNDNTWNNARLLIIDEVSFMSTSELNLLDEKLRTLLRRPNALYGNINILFCGDFRQLEPCGGDTLYSPRYSHKTWINSITCYVQLHGLHRFQDDPEWGHILSRIRNGTSDQTDIDAINECLVKPGVRDIPPDASYCVYTNADRTAINAGIFAQLLQHHCAGSQVLPEHMLVVTAGLMTKIPKKGGKANSTPLSASNRQYIYEHCSDHTIRDQTRNRKGHFVDPLLKLYYHAPLMLVTNDDVPNGHANGTRVLLEAVVLKKDVITTTISLDGYQCPTIDADLIHHLFCSLDGNPSKIFFITPRSFNCSVKVPVPRHFGAVGQASVRFKISMTQLPILINNATTGHKLQGQTKENLVISVWSRRRHWNYVALSRVRTRAGLYLVKPLPYTTDFSIDPNLAAMLQTLSSKQAIPIQWNLHQEESTMLQRFRHATNTSQPRVSTTTIIHNSTS
jgi:PIF1-like helicase